MTPITGPFTKTKNWYYYAYDGTPQIEAQWRQLTYRQSKPYDRPLVYHSVVGELVNWYSCSTIWKPQFSDCEAYKIANAANWTNSDVVPVYNKAYAKLVGKLKSDQAELGASLGEYRQTVGMVEDRASQLVDLAKAARRNGWIGSVGAMIKRVKTSNEVSKKNLQKLGRNYLEVAFGWIPTIQDLHTGLEVLTSGIPPAWASAKAESPIERRVTALAGSYPNLSSKAVTGGQVKVRVGCGVVLTNHNLWLANQLGLINPVSVAWELVPNSYIIDYFVNVNDVINSWTDFVGVDIVRPYRTFVVEYTSNDYTEYGLSDPGSPCLGGVSYLLLKGKASRMNRELNIPGPTLTISPPHISLRRAGTSIARLLTYLKG